VQRFTKQSEIAASAAEVFAFHERPDAFSRLQPPWQKSEILQPPSSLEIGTEVRLRIKLGPIWRSVVSRHVAYEPGVMFADEMIEGPFRAWYHEHRVTATGERSCLLTDDVRYELPLGALGRILGGAFARREIERLFAYRHRVTREACEALAG
jgi:ligand-binding SRPBCC domain-containing protein